MINSSTSRSLDGADGLSVNSNGEPRKHVLEQTIIDARHAHNQEELLAEIGYKQELKRVFNTFEVFGIAWSSMGLLASISSKSFFKHIFSEILILTYFQSDNEYWVNRWSCVIGMVVVFSKCSYSHYGVINE